LLCRSAVGEIRRGKAKEMGQLKTAAGKLEEAKVPAGWKELAGKSR
jgi:hypothetical protein